MRYSFFFIFSIFIVTLALTSCGGDSGDTDDENGGIGGLLGGIFDSRPTIYIRVGERDVDSRVYTYPEASSPVHDDTVVVIKVVKFKVIEGNPIDRRQWNIIHMIGKGETTHQEGWTDGIITSNLGEFEQEIRLQIVTDREEIIQALVKGKFEDEEIEIARKQPPFNPGPPVTHRLLRF